VEVNGDVISSNKLKKYCIDKRYWLIYTSNSLVIGFYILYILYSVISFIFLQVMTRNPNFDKIRDRLPGINFAR